ncbi:MAG: twin-arginine translocase subunit TatC [Chloroflexi bacterium]|nr:twin-arginine translocase subunit TatC [Chloroflexota bacterium]
MATTVEPGPAPDAPAPQPPEGPSGEMTLLDHLLELRSRVTWAAGAVVVGMSIFFIPKVGFATIEFLLEPARSQSPTFEAQAITPLENLVTYFRVALMGGVALGMPVLVYQTLRFITPALTPQETRWIYPLVIAATLSFVGGMAFAYWVVLPPAYAFLFTFGSSFATPSPTITSYMDLTIRLIGILGFVFELPIFIMGLARLRVVQWRRLLGWWRYAIIGSFIVSAIATPTIDPVTQSLVAGPMVILYFVGIALAWVVRPRG